MTALDTTTEPAPAPGDNDDEPTRAPAARGLVVLLVLLAAAVGFGIRWYAVTSAYPTCPEPKQFGEQLPEDCYQKIVWGDSFYYRTQAYLLAEGNGFANPSAWFQHSFYEDIPEIMPGAGHPPVYTVFLASLYKAGLTEVDQHRKVEVLVGTAGVLLIGLAGWQVGGRRRHVVAPLAALLAATYPMLWINDFAYLSESIYIPIVAVLIMACYRFWFRRSWSSAVLLGTMIGVAGLTRGEGFLLVVFTLPSLLWGMRELGVRHRLGLAAVVCGATGVVLAPWVIYNLARFPAPVTITSGTGMVLVHGSCDEAFFGSAIGYYSFDCANNLTSVAQNHGIVAEEVADAEARTQAIAYLKANADQLPVVMLARAGRMWDVYDPEGNLAFNAQLEGRGELPSRLGLWYYAALVPLGAVGIVDLRRRGIPLSPIVGLAAAATLTAMLSFGITRYRVPADVALVVAGAIGIDRIVRRGTAWVRAR